MKVSAEKAVAKARVCLKKQKNGEGLRALGEFWATWSEAIGALSNPYAIKRFDYLYDESISKYKVLEVLL